MGNEEYAGMAPISFPLGLAFLIITLISTSALFSCFYNWNRVRGFPRPPSMPDSLSYPTSTLPNSATTKKMPNDYQEQRVDERLTVVMPGDDEIPKFLAIPAPHGELQLETSAEL